MIAQSFDSRSSLGTDVFRPWARDAARETSHVFARVIRVVIGRLGSIVRLSAADLDIVADGATWEEAWGEFVGAVRQRDDVSWLSFDVGPLRPNEVESALDAPEDESWAEPADEDEDEA